MVSFPNAKINLGLNIVSKRPDGYHNISSVFYPVGWCDVLEIIPSERLKFTSSGIDIPGASSDNLCVRAYHLLNEEHKIPPVHIHLHKVIPIGAGLGGGSADCAFTLTMLNELFSLGLDNKNLEQKAGMLGSDCPFFIQNQPVMVSGTGDEFASVNLNLTGKTILLVYPNLHIPTSEAYAGIIPVQTDLPIDHVITQPMSNWKELLQNDFEKPIGGKHPQITRIKEDLYTKGAAYAAMTGSGSTVFGIFDQSIDSSTLEHFSELGSIWTGPL
ncbi:MAG: 4-(cytidine 5'-diphospho)-2-C-methyl-D-erythritol kinase [Cyclobacteriaceae bacterium]